MAVQWYFVHNGNQLGPCSPAQLKKLIETGKLKPADLVWREGLTDWMSLGSVRELAQFLPGGGESQMTATLPTRPSAEKTNWDEQDQPRSRKEYPPDEEDWEEDEEEKRPRPRKKKKKRKKSVRYSKVSKDGAMVLFAIAFLQLLCGLTPLFLFPNLISPDVPIPRETKLLLIAIVVGTASVFAGLGFWAMFQPLIPSVIGLVLILGMMIMESAIDPTLVLQGICVKIIFIGGLVKTILAETRS